MALIVTASKVSMCFQSKEMRQCGKSEEDCVQSNANGGKGKTTRVFY